MIPECANLVLGMTLGYPRIMVVLGLKGQRVNGPKCIYHVIMRCSKVRCRKNAKFSVDTLKLLNTVQNNDRALQIMMHEVYARIVKNILIALCSYHLLLPKRFSRHKPYSFYGWLWLSPDMAQAIYSAA